MARYPDLTGRRFGRLTVIKVSGRDERKNVLWSCQCSCGGKTVVRSHSLLRGNTKSCGCLKKDAAKRAIKGRKNLHGLSRDKTGKKTRLYRIWCGIKTRCFNPDDHAYKNYGGRGITLCKEWLDYKNFYNWAISSGYRDNLTIERIDNDGDYEPCNCTWIPRSKQAHNRKTSFRVTYRGETKVLSEWASVLQLNYQMLFNRLKYLGWSVEKAFSTPSTKSANNANKKDKKLRIELAERESLKEVV